MVEGQFEFRNPQHRRPFSTSNRALHPGSAFGPDPSREGDRQEQGGRDEDLAVPVGLRTVAFVQIEQGIREICLVERSPDAVWCLLKGAEAPGRRPLLGAIQTPRIHSKSMGRAWLSINWRMRCPRTSFSNRSSVYGHCNRQRVSREMPRPNQDVPAPFAKGVLFLMPGAQSPAKRQ